MLAARFLAELDKGPPTPSLMRDIAKDDIRRGDIASAMAIADVMSDTYFPDHSERGTREFYMWLGFASAASAAWTLAERARGEVAV